MHALRSVAELLTAYVLSPVEIRRDALEAARGTKGFPRQPVPDEMAGEKEPLNGCR
jgi:hypothetical protein